MDQWTGSTSKFVQDNPLDPPLELARARHHEPEPATLGAASRRGLIAFAGAAPGHRGPRREAPGAGWSLRCRVRPGPSPAPGFLEAGPPPDPLAPSGPSPATLPRIASPVPLRPVSAPQGPGRP